MVRVILDKTIDGVKYVIAVPDSASREDEIEEFIYWIKCHKTLAEKCKKARERLEELAEDEPLIDWLLHNEGWDKHLQMQEEYYQAVTLNLLKEFMDYVSADELVKYAPALFTSGPDIVAKRFLKDIRKAIEEGAGGEPDADSGRTD